MKLTDARTLFKDLVKDSESIEINRKHVLIDHRERLFTEYEIKALLQGEGVLKDNNQVDKPAPDSFLWHCKDNYERKCEIAIKFIDRDGNKVFVISAWRIL